jgi:hypothetical protein
MTLTSLSDSAAFLTAMSRGDKFLPQCAQEIAFPEARFQSSRELRRQRISSASKPAEK